jgi:hypothetical protein
LSVNNIEFGQFKEIWANTITSPFNYTTNSQE